MVDPVMQDLNAHLNREAREDSRSEAEQVKLEEWMKDSDKIEEAWDELVYASDSVPSIDVAIALTCHPDDRADLAMQMLDAIEAKIRAHLSELVSEAVDKDERQAAEDAAEDAAEERAFWREE